MSVYDELAISCCLADLTEYVEINGEQTATSLRRYLGWNERYVNLAIERGQSNNQIVVGAYNKVSLIDRFKLREEHFYDYMEQFMRSYWNFIGYQNNEFCLENTSRRSNRIEGRWTRPDFTMVSLKKFAWVKEHQYDVITFEVKLAQHADVLAVFEAMSHRSVASRAYVVIIGDKKDWEKQSFPQAQRVRDECVRYDIGLAFFQNIWEKPTFSIEIESQKTPLDLEKTSGFLGSVLTEESKNRIAAW